MNRFIRYWNQNRKKIIITIVIIVFVIIIIQLVNSFLKQRASQREERNKETLSSTQPIESVITGTKVPEEITKQNTDVIDLFVEYCNKGNYQSAFNLLDESGKKISFNNDINQFINNYAKEIFNIQKTYRIELWLAYNEAYTYKVKYYQDNLLATGSSNMDKNYEDYITIIRGNEKNTININGFIKEESINKSQKTNDVEVIINSKKIYKNYETYNITVKNYTTNTILLNNGQDSSNVKLIDKEEVRYSSYLNEIPTERFILKAGYQKTMDIRFNKIYNTYREIMAMEWKDIIMNYEKYRQNPNDTEINKTNINIEI